ncbi:tetratricopeptide repeat protein [Actinosynnema sp. NPDC091369]
MAGDEGQDALTFAEAYRRVREARTDDVVPFDVGQGLDALLTWMDREVDVVPGRAGTGPMRSGVQAELAVPVPRVELRGRHDLLEELVTSARVPGSEPAVLVGPGGTGKSTIAAAVAARLGAENRSVWWISAANAASLWAGLVALTRGLGGSSTDVDAVAGMAADGPDRLWRLLEQASREWLLVVDDADDPGLLRTGAPSEGATVAGGWIRSSRRGHVVVTSRVADSAVWATARLHPVALLSDVDAARVLRDLAPEAGGGREALILSRRLGGLPLALHLAGSYLRSGVARRPTFEDYRHALDEVSGTHRATDPEAPRVQEVHRTAEISLDGLADRGLPHARTLLRLASCYAPVAIPVDVFEPLPTAGPPGPGTDPRGARHLVHQALRGLGSVGLIESEHEDPAVPGTSIKVHPVVNGANRAHLGGADPGGTSIRHSAIDLLTAAVRELRHDLREDWPRYRLFGQHLLALLDTTAEHADRERLEKLMSATASTVRAFNRSGAPKAALALGNLALARCAALGSTHPASLRVQHQLAWAIANQGDLVGAEVRYQAVLDARLQVLGEDHADTCASRHELAWITACQGRWAQAESRYRLALHHGLRLLGPDAPEVLTTRHELAWAIANQGRFAEAHAALLDVRRDRERVLGERHQQTLATRHELAWVTAKRGEWATAEILYRDVLALRRRVLEDEHPETLLTTHELAWVVARLGRSAEAESLYGEALKLRRRTLGDDHPDTRETRLALEELRQGRIVDAAHLV